MPGAVEGRLRQRARDPRGRLRRPSAQSTAMGRKIGASRQPGGLRLLRQQADDDGRGRRPDHARQRSRGSGCERAQPGPRAEPERGWSTTGIGLQLPALRPRTPRSASPRSSVSMSCSTRATTWRRSIASGSRNSAPRPPARTRTTTSSCRARTTAMSGAGWFVFVVQLPKETDRDAVISSLGDQGHRLEGLPALHPPAAAVPGAVRLRGRGIPDRRSASPSARWRCRSSPR